MKTIAMMRHMADKLDEEAWDRVRTCHDFLKIFSLHAFVARALRLPLYEYYYPLKYARWISKLIQIDLAHLDTRTSRCGTASGRR